MADLHVVVVQIREFEDDDECILLLRCFVPEFEPYLTEYKQAEGDPVGSYETVARFADWVIAVMQQGDAPAIRRAFLAVEALAVMDSRWFQSANGLVNEFLQVLSADPKVGASVDAAALMGPVTRRRWNLPHGGLKVAVATGRRPEAGAT